ncbi:hypothetical protein C9374_011303 [Naegleria lovaniensis]|uniref:Uncharacterized protein n=1 Tax=Naegleria lovaniensis TaxID=51637 RepID=A0AA88H0L7_NAELO|nr:uncharacterized protein C9374_011303 [Naegleria lovaniensis]KAG2392578.1 hypothetical protein C9374_011303 [Naegleria lovaniensis]
MIKGRAVFKNAAKGWASIGFRTGFDYMTLVDDNGGTDYPKMGSSTFYVGFRDAYLNHYFQEYTSNSDATPQLCSKQSGIGFTRSLNTSQTNSDDIHIIFERPLIMTTSVLGYYQFQNGDNSSIMFAKNTEKPVPASKYLDDMCRHNHAEVMPLNFFAPSTCLDSHLIPPVPDYLEPLPSDYYDKFSKEKSKSNPSRSISLLNAFILYFVIGVTLFYMRNA